jgi:hypothetical protein
MVFSTMAGAALSHGALLVLPQEPHGDCALHGELQMAPHRRQPWRPASDSLAAQNTSPKAKTTVQILMVLITTS